MKHDPLGAPAWTLQLLRAASSTPHARPYHSSGPAATCFGCRGGTPTRQGGSPETGPPGAPDSAASGQLPLPCRAGQQHGPARAPDARAACPAPAPHTCTARTTGRRGGPAEQGQDLGFRVLQGVGVEGQGSGGWLGGLGAHHTSCSQQGLLRLECILVRQDTMRRNLRVMRCVLDARASLVAPWRTWPAQQGVWPEGRKSRLSAEQTSASDSVSALSNSVSPALQAPKPLSWWSRLSACLSPLAVPTALQAETWPCQAYTSGSA